jgi:hypothetical protein
MKGLMGGGDKPKHFKPAAKSLIKYAHLTRQIFMANLPLCCWFFTEFNPNSTFNSGIPPIQARFCQHKW